MDATLAGFMQVIGGLLGGGFLVALVTAWTSRRKNSADAESISIATANSLMTGMRSDIVDLRQRISRQDIVLASYSRRVDYLTTLLIRNNIAVEDWNAPV